MKSTTIQPVMTPRFDKRENGNLLRIERERHQLTVSEVSRKIGVSPSNYGFWESGIGLSPSRFANSLKAITEIVTARKPAK